jgi:hypothetical protein
VASTVVCLATSRTKAFTIVSRVHQGFKYRFGVKNWCPQISPKIMKTG